MTKEEIIELARECCDLFTDKNNRDSYEFDDHGLVAFANLVAAKERERCAKECDELAASYGEYGWVQAASNCSEAIRSLK